METKYTNIVTQKKLREIQLNTLETVNEVVSKTSGPFGSSTMLLHDNRFTEYSKDGHKVLNNIKFFRPLEQAVHDELINITEHVVSTVGDGTTTAVELSYMIFSKLMSDAVINAGTYPSHTIMDAFAKVVGIIDEKIASHGRDLTLEDIYQICMISTNGNKEVSEDISSIYKRFNLDVEIQVGTSNTDKSVMKIYDGIVFNKGFSSPAFINDKENCTATMRNPRIYYFADPVDTPEMCALFMNIFTKNIYEHYANRDCQYVPTVILAPSISQDIKGELEDIEKIFYAYDTANNSKDKPPFCIISGVNASVDNITDIITLCDCPSIRKFINADTQKKAIEEGNAPSPETVTEFYGTADEITIDINKTKIINPVNMFAKDSEVKEDGSREYSDTFNSLISFLEEQIRISSEDKEDINLIGNLKRRLHFLKSNFVEYLVGGVSVADRDNVKDLVEDAVLNCNSALLNGVGYGAGFEGLRAAKELWDENVANPEVYTPLEAAIIHIILEAYGDLTINLYSSNMSREKAVDYMEESLKIGRPYNLRDESFDLNQVLCSIKSDQVILHAIAKIITTMYLSNQALLVLPTQNIYSTDD